MRDKRFLLLFLFAALLFSSSVTNLFAAETETYWDKGNTFFEKKQYDSALAQYKIIEQEGYQNAALYYNMANAYYRLGRTGLAVLYYERAAFKNPNDKQISDNRTLAEERVELPSIDVSPIFFISWWHRFILLFSPTFWGWIMFLAFVACLGLVYLRVKNKEKFSFSGRWLSLSFALLFVAGLFFFLSYQARTHTDRAVVMKNNTIFFSTFNGSEQSGTLPEGAVIRIKKLKENRYFTTLPNGSHVWINQNEIEKVQP